MPTKHAGRGAYRSFDIGNFFEGDAGQRADSRHVMARCASIGTCRRAQPQHSDFPSSRSDSPNTAKFEADEELMSCPNHKPVEILRMPPPVKFDPSLHN